MAPSKIILLSALVAGATAFNASPAFSRASIALNLSPYEEYMQSRGASAPAAVDTTPAAPAETQSGGIFENHLDAQEGSPKSAQAKPKTGKAFSPGSSSNYLENMGAPVEKKVAAAPAGSSSNYLQNL